MITCVEAFDTPSSSGPLVTTIKLKVKYRFSILHSHMCAHTLACFYTRNHFWLKNFGILCWCTNCSIYVDPTLLGLHGYRVGIIDGRKLKCAMMVWPSATWCLYQVCQSGNYWGVWGEVRLERLLFMPLQFYLCIRITCYTTIACNFEHTVANGEPVWDQFYRLISRSSFIPEAAFLFL
jgi:hypothetical protein